VLVAILARMVEEHTDLRPSDLDHLSGLVGDWSLLADLALSDLVLWLPTWNEGGLVAAAQVRPTTAPTVVPADIVGTFAPKGRIPAVDQALSFGTAVTTRDLSRPTLPRGAEAFPVRVSGSVIAVIERRASAAPRVAGQLEEVYLNIADLLFSMVAESSFPPNERVTSAAGNPRVGDGIVFLDSTGIVEYASPNAISALRRLGLAIDVVGSELSPVAVRLAQRHGPVDDGVGLVASGRAAGRVYIESPSAAVLMRGIPLVYDGKSHGAVILLRDTTDIRRRERALISKDATIKEIHHRVKNNLQMVAALLRLQARRATNDETKSALAEAQLRISAIAVVHAALATEPGEMVSVDSMVDVLIDLVRDVGAGGTSPRIERHGDAGTLSAEIATPLAMVVSELLHNAIEHAQASVIDVRLQRSATEIAILVEDDGVGLASPWQDHAGLGLQIVTSLVESDLHGKFALNDREAAMGTAAEVSVPVARLT
jgi:two-component sensor histidine kinase